MVVVRVTGKALWEAIENGVHNYPGDEKSGEFHPQRLLCIMILCG